MSICPFCGKAVDKNGFNCIKNNIQGLDTRSYYHIQCHRLAQTTPKEEWPYKIFKAQQKNSDLDIWAENIYDYMLMEQRIMPDMMRIKSQMKNFEKKGMRPKGIFLSIRYFYEVVSKNGEDKSEGGIGIVPYVYEKAQAYWEEKARRDDQIVQKIEHQIKEMKEKKLKTVPYAQKKRQPRHKALSFEELIEMEDEE